MDEVGGAAARRLANALHEKAGEERSAGKAEAAATRLRRASVIDPFDPHHRIALAEVLLDLHRLDQAAACLAELRRSDPGPEFAAELEPLEQRIAQARTHARTRGPERPEFVGRSAEFADLVSRWRTVQRGRCLAVLLRGATGIGKTRLSEELAATVTAEGGTVVAIKGAEVERSVEGAFVASLVRRLLLTPGSGGVTTASDAMLRSLVPSLANGGGTLTPPPTFGVAVADAVGDLVGAVAYEGPLLVVLDDFHWADPASRAVIGRVLHHLRDEPVLFLLTYRPEDVVAEAARALDSLAKIEGNAVLTLRSFGRAEVAEFVSLAVEFSEPECSESVIDRFFAASGGSPLFLVELLRSLAEEGVIEHDDGRAVLRVDRLTERFRIPPSVHGVVERRLERLTEEASTIAAALAHDGPHISLDEVRELAALPQAAFSRGVAELVEREIVRWDGELLAFTHDQLREAVSRRFVRREGLSETRSWLRGRRRRAAAAILAASIAATSFVALRLAAKDLDPPLYGGGTIYLQDADSILTIETPGRADGEWRIGPPRRWTPRATTIVGPFLTTAGEIQWYTQVNGIEPAPYPVRIHEDGRTGEIIPRVDGDVNIGSVSPDGRTLSLAAQRNPGGSYQLDLIAVEAGDTLRRVLYRARGIVSPGRWSPDGRFLFAIAAGAADTLLVFKRTGERHLARALPPGSYPLEWCGGSSRLVGSIDGPGGPRLFLLGLEDGSVTPIAAQDVAFNGVACSPDGRAVVYTGIRNGRIVPVIHDLETSAEIEIPTRDPVIVRGWLPDLAEPVEETVSIDLGRPAIRVGEQIRPMASVRMTDGTLSPAPVTWSSSNDLIASVSPGGVVTGIRPGAARIVATASSFNADTLDLEVGGQLDRGRALRETFETLDRDRWIVVGAPIPVSVRVDGEPALHLNGDGRYTDGILLRQPIDLRQGGTLEAEFRLPLNRRDRQQFHVCLAQNELFPGRTVENNLDNWQMHNMVCATFPAGELTRFDPVAIGFGASPLIRKFTLGDSIGNGRWVRVAIQLLPDGRSSLYINQRHIADAPTRTLQTGSTSWRIMITGASVETRTLVRDIALWNGTRYEIPPDSTSRR